MLYGLGVASVDGFCWNGVLCCGLLSFIAFGFNVLFGLCSGVLACCLLMIVFDLSFVDWSAVVCLLGCLCVVYWFGLLITFLMGCYCLL